jgi:hypothetical protein
MKQITFAEMVTKTVNMINEKPARIKPYQKMYSGLDQIKESVSNAISQIEPEERARLMRLNEAPDKPDEICEECEKPIGSGDIGECRCYSVCCGAPIIMHDICSDCKEHV